jgi:hypothetical protein
MKSDLLLEMQLDAPVSIQMAIPPGEKFIIFKLAFCVDCQAFKYANLDELSDRSGR